MVKFYVGYIVRMFQVNSRILRVYSSLNVREKIRSVQFTGEGTPERTNKRFHYLSKDDDAKRLSTAFDSVTLYGEDPDYRPDIYGKVGESGVSFVR